MSDHVPQQLSRDEFERILARASQLDRVHGDGVTPVAAAEIAREIGVSGRAWEAALQEHQGMAPRLPTQGTTSREVGRYLLLGAITFAINAAWSIWRTTAGVSGRYDLFFLTGLIVAALVVCGSPGERPTWRQYLPRLTAWWVGMPLGLAVGFGGGQDGVGFGASGWVISAAILFVRERWLRAQAVKTPPPVEHHAV